MNSHKVEKSKSPLEEKERMDKEERLKLIREKWYNQQELERKHEARKLEMIEEYERRRAQELKIDHKQKSLRRSKSNSPQRRTTDYKYLEKLKISPSKYKKNTIIDEKELCKIKVNIYKERVCQTSQNISKNEIERHIDNLDDIVLPRRKDEGSCPIFEKIKAAEVETRTIRFLRDNKLEKQLSDEECIDTCKSTPFDTYKTVTQYSNSRSRRSIRHLDDRTDDKYKSDRYQSSSTKRSQEDRSRNERKNRSLSHCGSGTASTFRDRSSSRRDRSSSRRSRSSSPSNRAKERKQDYDKDKFSSRRNRSREPDVRVSSSHSGLATNRSPSYGFYDTCMRFPGPIYRIQAPPMIWPIAPGLFPAPFPPSTRWRSPRPPRFANYNVGRGFYRSPR